MKIHIITIFPEAFDSYIKTSIFRKAKKDKLVDIKLYKLNDFSTKKFKQVDDKAYGTHGQVISPEPLSKAINNVLEKVWKKVPVVYMSPRWEILTQVKLEKYYKKLSEEFIVICGHYEWIDERIIEKYVSHEISIWRYIITSWELASQVLIDSLIRFIPGVLWNEESFLEESYSKKLSRQKEYPHYTRPRIFEGTEVPEVLTSWDHQKIKKWKEKNLS